MTDLYPGRSELVTLDEGLVIDCQRIRELKAEKAALREKLLEVETQATWLISEVNECWEEGHISLDATTAAEALEAALRKSG